MGASVWFRHKKASIQLSGISEFGMQFSLKYFSGPTITALHITPSARLHLVGGTC